MVTVICNLTLDGVMQAPGRADEDERGGFAHGGWATPYAADAMGRLFAGHGDDAEGAMLFGRRTYQDFFDFWPKQGPNPFTEHLNRVTKYVVSGTLTEPLPWQNSVLISGDAANEIAVLKRQRSLTVLGSGALIRSLLPSGVIDEFKLLIHPIVLGSGQRLFDDGAQAALHLESVLGTTTGVVITTYRCAPGPAAG
jgi:dihydrofolate reductase